MLLLLVGARPTNHGLVNMLLGGGGGAHPVSEGHSGPMRSSWVWWLYEWVS